MIGLILRLVPVALIIGGGSCWARQGLAAAGPATDDLRGGKRHLWLLTQAMAGVGAILAPAGGGAAIGQRWTHITGWGHLAGFAGAPPAQGGGPG
jgi:hypothetical protein